MILSMLRDMQPQSCNKISKEIEYRFRSYNPDVCLCAIFNQMVAYIELVETF